MAQETNTESGTQEIVLAQLSRDLSEATFDIQGQKIDIVVKWLTHEDARTRSRRIDISLGDNMIGAYIFPIQNLTPLNGPTLDDVRLSFAHTLEAYLSTNGIPESRIQTGDHIEDYMTKTAEQAGPAYPPQGVGSADP